LKVGKQEYMQINVSKSDMATKREKEYLNRVANLGCICCHMMGYPESPAEIHHVRSGQGISQRASNYDVIPLCHAHHRTGGYGVAFHGGKKAFEENFATEEELLEIIKEVIRGQDAED